MADRDRLSRAISEAVSRAVSDALESALPQTSNRVSPNENSSRSQGNTVVSAVANASSTNLQVSTIKCASLQCKKNCTNEFVTILHGSDKCNVCWRCPECQEGLGSSVACGTNVSNDTSIHCVECVSGVNFSDSNGIKQCQPCGLCDGKHERLVAECTPEMNVLCECEDGYYRNETDGECLPCASCCSTEFKGDIQHECLDDGGKITRKCKFDGQKQTICESIWTTTPDPSLLVSSSEPSKTILTEIMPIRVNFPERQGVLNASASKSPDHTNPTPNNTQDWLWVIAAIVVGVIYIVITIRYFFLSQKWKQTTISSRSESSTSYSCRYPLLGAEDPPDHGIASQQWSARFFPTYPDGLQRCISNALEVANTGAQAKGAKWSALTQAEKYNTKMLHAPFLLRHRIYLMLDIKRSDGNDIRQFANILGITVKDFDCLEQMAKVKQVTSSEVILEGLFEQPTDTVGNFISIMEHMNRDDIVSLINAWKEKDALKCSKRETTL